MTGLFTFCSICFVTAEYACAHRMLLTYWHAAFYALGLRNYFKQIMITYRYIILLLLFIHKNISSPWSFDFFFLDKIRTSDDEQYLNVQGLHFLSWCNQLILLFFAEYLYAK